MSLGKTLQLPCTYPYNFPGTFSLSAAQKKKPRFVGAALCCGNDYLDYLFCSFHA